MWHSTWPYTVDRCIKRLKSSERACSAGTLLPLPSQTNDSWRIGRPSMSSPVDHKGHQGKQHPPRSGDAFGHESFLGWQLCSHSGQPALAGGLWSAQNLIGALALVGGRAALAARFRRQIAVLREGALPSRNALAALAGDLPSFLHADRRKATLGCAHLPVSWTTSRQGAGQLNRAAKVQA